MVRPKKIVNPIIINDSLIRRTFVDGLTLADSTCVWRTEPVSIDIFLTSPKYLNIDEKIIRPRVFDALRQLSDPKIKLGILICGRGSGKTFICRNLQAYSIYRLLCMNDPQRVLGLAPGTPIYLLNVARNERQARDVLFADFIGALDHSSWFKEVEHTPSEVNEYQRIALELRFFNNIHAVCANSSTFSWLGYHIFQFICDELCFYREDDEDEESESNAEEVWTSLINSCITHGNIINYFKAIGISSPRYVDDFGMQKLRELKERAKTNGDAFALHAATWDMDPEGHPKSKYHFDLARNYNRTMRDIGAIPTQSTENFFENVEIYKENANKDMINQFDENREVFLDTFKSHKHPLHIHFDLSLKKDHCGVYCAHSGGTKKITNEVTKKSYELPLAIIDFGIDINPKIKTSRFVREKSGEVDYASLVQLVGEIKDRGFEIEMVSFDRFQSAFIKQQIEDLDINVIELSLDKTDIPASLCKEAIADGRIEYFFHRQLDAEIRELQWVKGKKVDHKSHGAGKDCWDAFAGSVFRILNAEENLGLEFDFVDMETSDAEQLIGVD